MTEKLDREMVNELYNIANALEATITIKPLI
jgi:hypothetical protein